MPIKACKLRPSACFTGKTHSLTLSTYQALHPWSQTVQSHNFLTRSREQDVRRNGDARQQQSTLLIKGDRCQKADIQPFLKENSALSGLQGKKHPASGTGVVGLRTNEEEAWPCYSGSATDVYSETHWAWASTDSRTLRSDWCNQPVQYVQWCSDDFCQHWVQSPTSV